MYIMFQIDVVPREEGGAREEDKPADAKTLLRSYAILSLWLLSFFLNLFSAA